MSFRRQECKRLHPRCKCHYRQFFIKVISSENETLGRRETALGLVNSHFPALLEKIDTSEKALNLKICTHVTSVWQLFQLDNRNPTQQRSRIINLFNKAFSVSQEKGLMNHHVLRIHIFFSLTNFIGRVVSFEKQTAGNAGRLILNFLIMVGYY